MRPQMTVLDVLYNLLVFWSLVLCLAGGGCRLRVIMKRRPIGVSLAWLALISRSGVGCFGLSYSRRNPAGAAAGATAQAMYWPYVAWLQHLIAGFPISR